MTFSRHLTTFAGHPVRPFDPKSKRAAPFNGVYRVGGTYFVKSEFNDAEYTFAELLGLFLDAHEKGLASLVLGAWDYGQMCESQGKNGGKEVVEAMVANRGRMRGLRRLFFGDVTFDECEISWINPGDVSALLPAFPKLEGFRLRGGNNLTFGSLSHKNLRSFAIESGGLPESVVAEVCTAKLPALEHLELWLGTDDYGGIAKTDALEPLLSGRAFKKLRHLGLCNSEIADEVAKAVATSPLLERLEVLDLSRGTLTDVGAEALLMAPAVRKLKRLDLHHHFLSRPFMDQLEKLPVEVDVTKRQKPDFFDSGEKVHTSRFIVASE